MNNFILTEVWVISSRFGLFSRAQTRFFLALVQPQQNPDSASQPAVAPGSPSRRLLSLQLFQGLLLAVHQQHIILQFGFESLCPCFLQKQFQSLVSCNDTLTINIWHFDDGVLQIRLWEPTTCPTNLSYISFCLGVFCRGEFQPSTQLTTAAAGSQHKNGLRGKMSHALDACYKLQVQPYSRSPQVQVEVLVTRVVVKSTSTSRPNHRLNT